MNENMDSSSDRTPLSQQGMPRDASDAVEFSAQAPGLEQGKPSPHSMPLRKRRVRLPVILFVATCASTFWVGMSNWQPLEEIFNVITWSQGGMAAWYDPYISSPAVELRRDLIQYTQGWKTGFLYMATMLGILFAPEMGHLLIALR